MLLQGFSYILHILRAIAAVFRDMGFELGLFLGMMTRKREEQEARVKVKQDVRIMCLVLQKPPLGDSGTEIS